MSMCASFNITNEMIHITSINIKQLDPNYELKNSEPMKLNL